MVWGGQSRLSEGDGIWSSQGGRVGLGEANRGHFLKGKGHCGCQAAQAPAQRRSLILGAVFPSMKENGL